MQRLKRKRAAVEAARPKYSPWLVERLTNDVEWIKSQYVNGRDALLDDYNQEMLKQLVPLICRCLRYLDIPYKVKYCSQNIVELKLG